MDWKELSVMARVLRDVEIEPTRFVVAGQPFVRLVDKATVAFMTDERDALIAKSPAVYFTNERFAEMPVVLAKLDKLGVDEARAALRAAYKLAAPAKAPQAKAEKSEGPRLFYLAYVADGDKPERRKFRKLGRGTTRAWLTSQWQLWNDGKSFDEKLDDRLVQSLERAFSRAAEAETVAALCSPHMYSDGDDFEGVAWEVYVFDEEHFREEQSDYLPHPERGEREKNRDDGYRELLAKHGKHLRAR